MSNILDTPWSAACMVIWSSTIALLTEGFLRDSRCGVLYDIGCVLWCVYDLVPQNLLAKRAQHWPGPSFWRQHPFTREHEGDVCVGDRLCMYAWSCVCMCDRVCVCVIFGRIGCVARYFYATTSKSVTDSLCFLSLFPSFFYLYIIIYTDLYLRY